MLTQEQIKSLKKGDPVIIHGTFIRECANSDILCKVAKWHGGDDFGIAADSPVYARPRCVSLPPKTEVTTPKYDPCRPFREGDVVRFRKVNGNNARCRYNGVEIKEGSLGRIVKDGGRNCFWVEFDVHHNWCLDAAYFELITPVEELEQYSIDPANTNVLFKCGKKLATFEDDDEARDMCDRLNAEYRKEQK